MPDFIPIIIATETPVPTEFPNGVRDEIIVVSGIKYGEQVPFIDTHSSYSVQNVIGSVRNIRVEDNRLLGDVYFADDESSQRVKKLYEDKHLTGVSVGLLREQSVIQDGTSYLTESTLKEVSAVVAGADPEAVSLIRFLNPLKGEKNMADEVKNPSEGDESLVAPVVENTTEATKEPETKTEPTTTEAVVERGLTQDVWKARAQSILTLCQRGSVPQAQMQKYLLQTDLTPDQVARDILERGFSRSSASAPGSISVGKSEGEKVREALEDAVLIRMAGNINFDQLAQNAKARRDNAAYEYNKTMATRMAKPAPGAKDFEYARPADVAKMLLERAHVSTAGMPDHRAIKIAMKSGYQSMDSLSRSSVYMTQGSLANIYLNAMNKTLLASYDEVPSTYQQWVRQAASVADLKPVNRIRLGEFPSPEKVMRLGDYPQISAGSSKQSYSVEKQGFIFSLAWEDLVNDDLDALSKTPMMMGMAMRRAINYDAYAVLAGNVLADGTNIFTTANGTQPCGRWL